MFSDADSESHASEFVENPVIRKETPDEEKFRSIHIVAFILSATLGRQYSGWTPALSNGFGGFGIAQLMCAASCIMYMLCLTEIWSAIPFSGGNYGLTRASMGFFLGFLDGGCEVLVYVAHSALSALSLGTKMQLLFDLPEHYILVFCFVFYAISVWLTAQRRLFMLRRAYVVLAAVSLIILLLYLFGMLKYVDFLENASLHKNSDVANVNNWFQNGFSDFMLYFPLSSTPYAGMKSFALLTINSKDPKRMFPFAVTIAFLILFCVNMLDIFVFASQPGGILMTAAHPMPMLVGNELMFKLDPLNNLRLTLWLSLPSSFAKLLTYILPSGNLFHCLGNSYYLPPFLCLNKTQDRTNGCIVSGVFGMLLCIAIYYEPTIDLYNVTLFFTILTAATFIYGYIKLKTTFSNVQREFKSPFGIAGGVYCCVVFVIIFVAGAFFQKDWFTLEFSLVYFGILTIYYFAVARKGDRLCEEEDKVFLQMHVRNFNRSKKKHLRRHKTSPKVLWFRNSRTAVYVDSSLESEESASISSINSKDASSHFNSNSSQKCKHRPVDAAIEEVDEQLLMNSASQMENEKEQSSLRQRVTFQDDLVDDNDCHGLATSNTITNDKVCVSPVVVPPTRVDADRAVEEGSEKKNQEEKNVTQ